MFIAIDPGKNVGVATFSATGEDLSKAVLSIDNFRRLFLASIYHEKADSPENTPPLVFIMEDFTLRKDKAIDQTGSDMPAPRCIGAVEQINDMLGLKSEIVFVQAGNLKGSLKWAGLPEYANKPRTFHVPDDIAAYAHGVKYLIDLGLRKHPIFE